jgi:transposase
MMSEYTSLTSYLDDLKAKREALDNVDIDALVAERIAEAKAKIRAEVSGEIVQAKFATDIKISAITDAITIVTRANETAEDAEVESSEIIVDETY